MARSIESRKTVYGVNKYKEVVNTEFTSFGLDDDGEIAITVPEFFDLYENLYLDIPLVGENSHTALINRSSELVNVDTENAEVALLFEEINDLREQVASGSARVAELELGSLEASQLRQEVGTLKSQIQDIKDLTDSDGGKRKRFNKIEDYLNRQGL